MEYWKTIMEDWETWNNVGRQDGKRTFSEVKQDRNSYKDVLEDGKNETARYLWIGKTKKKVQFYEEDKS